MGKQVGGLKGILLVFKMKKSTNLNKDKNSTSNESDFKDSIKEISDSCDDTNEEVIMHNFFPLSSEFYSWESGEVKIFFGFCQDVKKIESKLRFGPLETMKFQNYSIYHCKLPHFPVFLFAIYDKKKCPDIESELKRFMKKISRFIQFQEV